MPVLQTFNNKILEKLNQQEQEKLLPFIRAWSWGINFDDETKSLAEYQIENGHHLRLITQSAILEKAPDLFRIIANNSNKDATPLFSIETLANLNFPIDVIHEYFKEAKQIQVYNNDEPAKIIANKEESLRFIREVCAHAKKDNRRTTNDDDITPDQKASLPTFSGEQYEQTNEQTIALYNLVENLGEGYSFEQDCKPRNFARSIQMETLANILGFNLITNDHALSTDPSNKINIYVTHERVFYDPNCKNHPNLYADNQPTPVIHNGTCGYHTILLLLKDAWNNLDKNEKEKLLAIKKDAQQSKPYNLIHPVVKAMSKPGLNFDHDTFSYRDQSMFNHIRPICYGTLLVAVTTSIAIMGWSSFIALMASPAGPAVIAGVLITVLCTELLALQQDFNPSYA